VSSAFIYAATTIAMRTLPATMVASSGTLVTPIAILVAWAHLGERPSPGGVVGAVLVVVGVVLVGASSR
jgi:drug/metabolite transporter (DMT)-like permease